MCLLDLPTICPLDGFQLGCYVNFTAHLCPSYGSFLIRQGSRPFWCLGGSGLYGRAEPFRSCQFLEGERFHG